MRTGRVELLRGASDLGANEDVLIIAGTGTHMDALSHVYAENKIYNGFGAETFSASSGAAKCGIENAGGFAAGACCSISPVTSASSGLEPGTAISGDDLEACPRRAGSGDSAVATRCWCTRAGSSCSDLGGTATPFPSRVCAVDGAVPRQITTSGRRLRQRRDRGDPVRRWKFLTVHIELLVKWGISLIEHLNLRLLAD